MKPAKLVHIAVRSGEPGSLAEFYQRAFGLKEVLSNRRAVDLWGWLSVFGDQSAFRDRSDGVEPLWLRCR
jgi:hypothetical protein